jgi:hypothetical protein
VEELARYIRSQRPTVARRVYSADIRSLVCERVRIRRTEDASWQVVSNELGLPVGTLKRWLTTGSAPGFLPVVVREPATATWPNEPSAERVLVLANGVHGRGLTASDVLALARDSV